MKSRLTSTANRGAPIAGRQQKRRDRALHRVTKRHQVEDVLGLKSRQRGFVGSPVFPSRSLRCARAKRKSTQSRCRQPYSEKGRRNLRRGMLCACHWLRLRRLWQPNSRIVTSASLAMIVQMADPAGLAADARQLAVRVIDEIRQDQQQRAPDSTNPIGSLARRPRHAAARPTSRRNRGQMIGRHPAIFERGDQQAPQASVPGTLRCTGSRDRRFRDDFHELRAISLRRFATRF
jgi:hypothetical protein